MHAFLPSQLLQQFKDDPVLSTYPSHIYTDTFEKFRFKTVSVKNHVFIHDEVSLRIKIPHSPVMSLEKDDQRTYLHMAALLGDVPLAYEMIRMGLDLDLRDKWGMTPLFLACTVLREMDVVKKTYFPIMFATFGGSRYSCGQAFGWATCRCQYRSWEPDTPDISADKEKFKSLVDTIKPGSSRPSQPCPCWSGKKLSDCHGVGKHLYPAAFPCRCGQRKAYGSCCAKKQFDIFEAWDPKRRSIQNIAQKRLAIPMGITDEMFLEGNRYMRELQALGPDMVQRKWNRPRILSQMLAFEPDMDRAFLYTTVHGTFHPRPWDGQLSKAESKTCMEKWNALVDTYIASGVDSRSRFDIELAAKISMSGGPLYKHCDATNCRHVEKRDVPAMKTCGRCQKAFYCSQDCQKSDWAIHKRQCGNILQQEQRLMSQIAVENAMNRAIPATFRSTSTTEFSPYQLTILDWVSQWQNDGPSPWSYTSPTIM
ncbi:unnamed protein product [Somion occarium]|uniref:MYND-type domain-containing protein n=1 Tax=Somion occarium TaxID=3059160 RepID=A0ABP1EAX0_9APHY